jgi:hypothetical protein
MRVEYKEKKTKTPAAAAVAAMTKYNGKCQQKYGSSHAAWQVVPRYNDKLLAPILSSQRIMSFFCN